MGVVVFVVILSCLFLMFLIIYGIVFEGFGEDVKVGVVGLVMVILGGVFLLLF